MAIAPVPTAFWIADSQCTPSWGDHVSEVANITYYVNDFTLALSPLAPSN